MGAMLHELGFDTFMLKNVSNIQARTTLDQWFKIMPQYNDVLFYFSGHGFMVVSNNVYMAPIEYDPTTYDNADDRALHTYYLLKKFIKLATSRASRPLHKLIIVDACRDFPSKKQMQNNLINKVDPNQPVSANLRQVGIWYSTAPGDESTGTGPGNSLGTQALLAALRKVPGESLETVIEYANGFLDADRYNEIQFHPGDGPVDWRFATLPVPIYVPYPYTPFSIGEVISNPNVCETCYADRLTDLFKIFGMDLDSLRNENRYSRFRRLRSFRDATVRYSSEFLTSSAGAYMRGFFDKFHIRETQYDPQQSFVVYEFTRKTLETVQVYLKYADRSLRHQMADAFHIDLHQFSGLTYFASGRGNEIAGSLPFADSNATLFGQLYEYGYTILEIGNPQRVFLDSYNLEKFRTILRQMDKPVAPGYSFHHN